MGGSLRRGLIFGFLLYLVEETLVIAETVVLLPDGVPILLPTIESTYYQCTVSSIHTNAATEIHLCVSSPDVTLSRKALCISMQ